MVASLMVAVIAVNLTHPNGTFQTYPARYALGLAGFGFLMATLVCTAAVLVSLRAATVRQASQNLAFGMMAVYFAAIFGFQALSRAHRTALMQAATGDHLLRNAGVAILALVAVDALLLGAAKARFKRARLILD